MLILVNGTKDDIHHVNRALSEYKQIIVVAKSGGLASKIANLYAVLDEKKEALKDKFLKDERDNQCAKLLERLAKVRL